MDGPVLELESGEDLFSGTILGWTSDLARRRASGEYLYSHGLDLVEHHLASIAVKLARKREGLTVDNADVGNTVGDMSNLRFVRDLINSPRHVIYGFGSL